ncbi:unnamed protein product [Urochloa decumbens]|uniref:DUF7378 domain-containing protein n=1 Tax=Urochloa decumbens TaxID=240449 RepID=A0ABC8W9T0_9POAL
MAMTVGELNKKNGISRTYLWTWAIFVQLVFFALALGVAYGCYHDDVARTPRSLLAAMAWLPYVTLCHVIQSYLSLFLPLAPVAICAALVIVAMVGTVVLMLVALAVIVYGHTAAFIAFGSVLVIILAVLLAIWYWLDRTYRAVDSLPS